jgi:hypothetical protein
VRFDDSPEARDKDERAAARARRDQRAYELARDIYLHRRCDDDDGFYSSIARAFAFLNAFDNVTNERGPEIECFRRAVAARKNKP